MTIRAKLEEKIKVCEKTQKRAEIAGLDYLSLYYAGLGDACNWMLTLLKISKIEVSQNEFRVKELQEKIEEQAEQITKLEISQKDLREQQPFRKYVLLIDRPISIKEGKRLRTAWEEFWVGSASLLIIDEGCELRRLA